MGLAGKNRNGECFVCRYDFGGKLIRNIDMADIAVFVF
jgi:hypothetical protein